MGRWSRKRAGASQKLTGIPCCQTRTATRPVIEVIADRHGWDAKAFVNFYAIESKKTPTRWSAFDLTSATVRLTHKLPPGAVDHAEQREGFVWWQRTRRRLCPPPFFQVAARRTARDISDQGQPAGILQLVEIRMRTH